MKFGLLLASFLLSASSDGSSNDDLMNEIERQVRLPSRAYPLNAYGRYYAFDGKRRVKAVYLLPPEPVTPDPVPADWGCEEVVSLGGNLATREVPCGPDPDASHHLEAGQRRWLEDRKALPFIADGGCAVVHLVFNLETRAVEHAFCNG